MSDYVNDIHAELSFSKSEGPDIAARLALGFLQATGKVSKFVIGYHKKENLKGPMLFLDTGPVYGKEEGITRVLEFVGEALEEINRVKKED